jgi:capsular exopolysaccharide synthesis family protein
VEYLDSSIKTTDELEKACRIPALGVVPLYSDNSKKLTHEKETTIGLVPYNQPMAMLSEAIFHIRSSIMLTASDSAPQVLVVTSANPDEGKTTVSSNLAVAMSSPEGKCILIDGDLRKPASHKVFSLPLQPGLTNYLTGSATLEEIIRPTNVPNLYFISAGPTPPNPNELFLSSAFKNLVSRLRQEYQRIIIDSPPIIGFADGRSLAASADGVVLIVKHHFTSREAGRLAVQLLSQNHCRILGGILSMARKDRMGYGGYYGYYQYYHKYYKKYHEADGGKS